METAKRFLPMFKLIPKVNEHVKNQVKTQNPYQLSKHNQS